MRTVAFASMLSFALGVAASQVYTAVDGQRRIEQRREAAAKSRAQVMAQRVEIQRAIDAARSR